MSYFDGDAIRFIFGLLFTIHPIVHFPIGLINNAVLCVAIGVTILPCVHFPQLFKRCMVFRICINIAPGKKE